MLGASSCAFISARAPAIIGFILHLMFYDRFLKIFRGASQIIILALPVLALANNAPAASLDLIPLPARIESTTGTFDLSSQPPIVAEAALTNEAALLRSELKLNYPRPSARGRIFLALTNDSGLGAEGYQLSVRSTAVVICAVTPAGIFYGGQTLRQLAQANHGRLPAVTITDSPRYAWRGLMLDVSRHFFDEPVILRLLDQMAAYKLNRLHLHLTDDPGWRLALEKYPELTTIGARGNYSDTNAAPRYFSRAQMRTIIAYAAQRHIVVVPEIDMPGHAGAAIRTFPNLDGGLHTFNPARPETYEFLDNVLRETMDIFPSPWIHLGGDEVNRSAWNQNPEVTAKLQADGLKDTQQLEAQFINRMAGFITAQGRTPAGWDEVVAANTPTNTLIFWWRHDKPEMLTQALATGHEVVLTPRDPCYFDYPQDTTYPPLGRKLYNTEATVYRGPIIPDGIPSPQLNQILGVEACVWTEHIPTVPYLEFKTQPRLAALAEMAWTPDTRRNFADFTTRLQPFLKEDKQRGLHYYDATNPAGSLQKVKP
jgi:hexosaminidase